MNKNMSDDKKIEITEADKQAAAESLRNVPYARLLGFELVDLSANEAKIRLQMRDELRQPYGVLLGFGISFLAAFLIQKQFDLQFEFSSGWIISAIIIAVGGSLVGALYPAWRASDIDPVEVMVNE